MKKDFCFEGDQLTAEDILEFIKKHLEIRKDYIELENMYIGHHEILDQTDKPKPKPDNRLVVNHAKYIVDTFNGFFMGNAVKTNTEDDTIAEYLAHVERLNDIDDLNAELSKQCDIYGHGFELLYMDEEAQVGIVNISPKDCFLIKDNSIRQNTIAGVRYRITDDDDIEGTYSDSEYIYYFTVTDDEISIVDEIPHPFLDVPIIEYVENTERLGAFEPVKTLINAYNKAISEKANDVDYFADAYLLILGVWLEEQELQRLRDGRVINIAVEDEHAREFQSAKDMVVEFLEKPDADNTQENLLNRLEDHIFSLAMVANINDEKFGTASGIALQYKLLSMSNLANVKERKFVKGFNKRYELISNVPNTPITTEDLKDISYTFTRNIPNNLAEEVAVFKQLGVEVSNKTMLENLSIINDVETEEERLEEENSFVIPLDYNFEGAEDAENEDSDKHADKPTDSLSD